MKKKILSGLLGALFSAAAFGFDPFVVKDIRVEGIQRTEAGTVFSYLPVKVGETFTDEAFQATWETTRGQAGAAGIITNFVGGDHGVAIGSGTAESQRDAFLDGFNKLFPGATAASNGKVVRFHWPTHPHTLGSYAAYRPGQWRAFAGEEGKPVGAIHFCGEHTSVDFQGYMEGAAETGARAAEEVATALGKSSALIIQDQILSLGGDTAHPSWRIWARARALAAGIRRRRRGYRGLGRRLPPRTL